MAILAKLLSIAAVVSMIPAVQGHMAMWHPSVYGFNDGDDNVNPLAWRNFNDWWFHGKRSDHPSKTMTLIPGQDLKLELACSKHYTSYGGADGWDACPPDAGSFHAGGSTGTSGGWGNNKESNLMGCAVAIAYKSNPWDVQPEDFTVMSVQERCVRQKDTTFSLPSNLPKCPEGGCTCAWFWQGKNSADEMYMNAFKCDVKGGTNGAIPRPKKPRRGDNKGATQPMYWANDRSNLDFTPDWSTKPSYNSAWGWENGAQTAAFGADNGGNEDWNDNESTPSATSVASPSFASSASSASSEVASSTSSSRRPKPTSDNNDHGHGNNEGNWNNNDEATPTWNNHAAIPTSPIDSTIPSDAAEPVVLPVEISSSLTSDAPATTPPSGGKCKPRTKRSLSEFEKSMKRKGMKKVRRSKHKKRSRSHHA